MKVRLILIGCVIGVAAALATSHAMPQVEADDMQAQMKEMMDKWMATTTPGPEHEFLERAIGTWEMTTKVWWGGPDSEPIETHGTSTRTWVLGKRFVLDRSSFQHAIPDLNGGLEMKDVEGIGLIGFDRVRNLYVSTWADSMSTQIMSMQGTRPAGSDRINFYGEMDEVMLDMYGRTVKFVKQFPDADTEVFEIYDLAAGDDHKVVEIVYTRKDS